VSANACLPTTSGRAWGIGSEKTARENEQYNNYFVEIGNPLQSNTKGNMTHDDAVLLMFLLPLAACVVFGCVAATTGAKKEATKPAFLLGFFLGPIGVLIACSLDNRPECPECRARVSPLARSCPFCRTSLAKAEMQPQTSSPSKSRVEKKKELDALFGQRFPDE
jgi:hypothetical protein